MSEELKPCQCGGNATLEQFAPNGLVIRCHVCGIQYKQKVLSMSLDWLREIMVLKWNTRPIEDALRAENDRLRAVINSHAQSGCNCQFCKDARELAERI